MNEVGARLVLMVLVLAVPLWLAWAWLSRQERHSHCRRCNTPTRAPLCIRCAIHHAARIIAAAQRDRERASK